jgi:hypothetical protein
MMGYRITDDLNFAARKTILWIGDSIVRGSGNPGGYMSGYQMYPFIVRDYINSLGYNYRLINKAQGGASSINGEQWRVQGRISIANPAAVGLVMYNFGANDSASPAAYTTNLSTFVPWALTQYPGATIIVLGPTPAADNGLEAALVTIRANGAAYVSGLNNPQVLFLSLGNAFNRTLGTVVYSTADTPGFGIHPNINGNSLTAGVITTFLGANAASIP